MRNRLILTFLSFVLFSGSIYGEQYPERFEGHFAEYNGKRLELIAKFIPKNPIIFEAGGHYGHDTVRFSQQWPESTIISFEPNPHAFAKLLESIKDNPNAEAHNLALNTYNGTAIFNVCHGSNGDNDIFEGASSILEASDWMEENYQGPKIEVPCVVLDDWCKANHIDHIDFMWLDLEGFELQTLQSSPKILKRTKVIYTETNFLEFRKGMTQFKKLKKHLKKSGFKMLSHWYAEGFQGNAIFVKKELYRTSF